MSARHQIKCIIENIAGAERAAMRWLGPELAKMLLAARQGCAWPGKLQRHRL